MTALVHTRAALAAARSAMPGTVAVVMTMGALHEGHAALLRAARAQADHVIVTIFVNPLQFGPTEDFDRYPRTLDADQAICTAAGADLIFAPSAAEMYPGGKPSVSVTPGPVGELFEGASRPGFFHGVLTVVAKLLQLTRPDLAFFGEKDYQQLTVIRLMVRDLNMPVEVIGVPTVREADGLALSSRNRYLGPQGRTAGLRLSSALSAGADAAAQGASPAAALAAAEAAFAAPGTDDFADAAAGSAGSGTKTPLVKLDYLVLTDPDLGPAPEHGPARLLIAAWVGDTRLIDNAPLTLR